MNSHSITVIDTDTATVVGTIATDRGVGGIGFTTDGSEAYVSEAAGPVRALDTLNNLVQGATLGVSGLTDQLLGLVLDYPGQLAVYTASTLTPTGKAIPLDEERYDVLFHQEPPS